MPKSKKFAVDPLPAALRPARSSRELVVDHLERLMAGGTRQKVVAHSLGLGPNFLSMLKSGDAELPLPRVIAFAAAAGLSEDERIELLDTRLRELHGQNGDICLETLAQWGVDLVAPAGDEKKLLDLWRSAITPAPHLLSGLLDRPDVARRVSALFESIAQEELQAQAAASQEG